MKNSEEKKDSLVFRIIGLSKSPPVKRINGELRNGLQRPTAYRTASLYK